MAQCPRADDPGGRAGLEHPDALRPRLAGLVETAGRLDDEERTREARAPEVLVDLAEVTADLGPDVGVGHHGRAALELPVLLGELVRGGDEHGGPPGLEDRAGPRLVDGVAVAVQEQDRRRLDAELVERLAQRLHLALVEGHEHLPVGEHALADLEAQGALDQGLVLAEEEVVGVGAVDPPDLVDIAKALGGDERGAGPGPLENRVHRDGRAVQEYPGCGVVGPRSPDARGDALHEARGRRENLAEGESAGRVVEDGDVGEGAADVGGQSQTGAGSHAIERLCSTRGRLRERGAQSP